MAINQAGAHQTFQQLFSCGDRRFGRHRSLVIKPFQQHDKFIAAHAGQGVFSAQGAGQTRRDLAQQAVADQMAKAVVDGFKVIQVDKQQRAQGVIAQFTIHGVLQAVDQQTAIGQAGEFIAKGQALDLTLVALTLGDVRDAHANQRRLTGHAHQTHFARQPTAHTVAVQPLEHWRLTIQRAAQINSASLRGQPTVSLFVGAQVENLLAEQLFTAVTQQAQGIFIALDHRTTEVKQQNGLGGMFNHGAVTRFGLQTLADVFHQQHKHTNTAGAVAHGAQTDAGMHQALVRPAKALFQLKTFALTAMHLIQQRLFKLQVIGKGQAFPGAAQQLLAGAVEDAAKLLIDLLPGKAGAGQGHANQRRFKEQAQAFVAFAQLLFGVFARADVL